MQCNRLETLCSGLRESVAWPNGDFRVHLFKIHLVIGLSSCLNCASSGTSSSRWQKRHERGLASPGVMWGVHVKTSPLFLPWLAPAQMPEATIVLFRIPHQPVS